MTGLRPAKLLVVAVTALVLTASASVALARQVALVVGNSSYAHIGRLPNPENDAVDLAAALRRLGFEVTTELDADRGELTEALRAFTRQSAGADVSLVFYAGHGLEMVGINYLVPVDARLERDVDVRYETVTLDDLLVSTVGARLRLVILDACRNNPLARSMQRTVASRSVSGGSFGQLDEDLLGDETLVAYAAAAGTTAADGTGRNSPYTSALLAHLDEPLEILTLFRRVRARVLEATNGEQRPHEYQSLLRGPRTCSRTVQPRLHVRHRSWGAGGRRGSCPMVPSRCRPGAHPGAVQPRLDVRVWPRDTPGPSGGGSVVPLGGRPRGCRRTEEARGPSVTRPGPTADGAGARTPAPRGHHWQARRVNPARSSAWR